MVDLELCARLCILCILSSFDTIVISVDYNWLPPYAFEVLRFALPLHHGLYAFGFISSPLLSGDGSLGRKTL